MTYRCKQMRHDIPPRTTTEQLTLPRLNNLVSKETKLMNINPLPAVYAKWVKIDMLQYINGYTPDAVRGKIKKGIGAKICIGRKRQMAT